VIVVSPRREEIATALGRADIGYVVQDPPRGTGDAVRVALRALDGDADLVLVTNGDVPLLTSETLRRLIDTHRTGNAAATLLTTDVPPTSDHGRVLRTSEGSVDRIVEVGDASEDELAVTEGNAGVYVFDSARLTQALDKVDTSNVQGEFYLTDVIGVLRAADENVLALSTSWEETRGVNDRTQLAEVTALLHRRAAERWLADGVTIIDPSSTFIDVSVTIERDATILPFTFLEGNTTIGAGATVGPQCRVVDSRIAEEATVTFAVVRGSEVGPAASVGPFASLRPGTKLARGAKLGTFVESKNSSLGADSKANHLAYLGDAVIGSGVNIGAGTITCNWDGIDKHPTVIEDDAYISSDTMLVAPLRIGKGAATGAGSVVLDDVPDGALAVGVPARIIEGKGNRTKRPGRES
jgi:bifunctional UDP-N-acetylglucosamine pyrophosphorylase/glucosamine-1-phosphate N-acetyltransferase